MKKQHDNIETAIETIKKAPEAKKQRETQLPTIYFVAVIAMTCFAVGMF